MNQQLEKFLKIVDKIKNVFHADLIFEISEPYDPDGVWILDLSLAEYSLSVHFKNGRKIGLYSGDDDWTNHVDEVYESIDQLALRVVFLLQSKGKTIPVKTLQELRASKTQSEVAKAMRIKQPSYAKMEKDNLYKLKLDTLNRIVEANNAKLHLLVEDGDEYYILASNKIENRCFSDSVKVGKLNVPSRLTYSFSHHPKIIEEAGKFLSVKQDENEEMYKGCNVVLVSPNNMHLFLGNSGFTACEKSNDNKSYFLEKNKNTMSLVKNY